MHTNGTNSIVFSAATILLTGSIILGRQQDRQLTGVHGLPVEGHDIVAGIEILGTTQIDYPKIRARLRGNGADLRLGFPLQSQMLCRFKEVLRDVMSEKGFLDAEVTHDTRTTYGNPRHLTLTFTITEGKRSRPIAPARSPAQRCRDDQRSGTQGIAKGRSPDRQVQCQCHRSATAPWPFAKCCQCLHPVGAHGSGGFTPSSEQRR